MKPFNISRRRVLRGIAGTSVAGIMGPTLSACGGDSGDDINALAVTVDFNHGVASGDPLANKVIIWTRATPDKSTARITLNWEMSTEEDFSIIIGKGTVTTTPNIDYTVKLDVSNLDENTVYYYRFQYGNKYSPTGRTKTLSRSDVDNVRLALVNCSNYPAGYFHVYREVANGNFDAVIHVGDYIYEYEANGYASEDAAAMNRVVAPLNELITLDDYRTRYAQYHTDADLQAAHASAPFICVWDDHEIANDAWNAGAENHDVDNNEGDYSARRVAALQAYYEWLPIRPPSTAEDKLQNLWRHFSFGNLVDLYMVDTRHFAREQALSFADYTDTMTNEIDDTALRTAIAEPRALLGETQLNWLVSQLEDSDARWQVLGQQVLMGRMMIPAPIMAAINATQIEAGYNLINAAVEAKNAVSPTPEQTALLESVVPYNLDAWDGYAAEREALFDAAAEIGSKLIVLAGDTHNAWGNQLRRENGDIVGVELAAASVSSPGLEYYLGLGAATAIIEEQIKTIVDDLEYVNLVNRGFLDITFTSNNVSAQWRFVSTIKEATYQELIERNRTATVDWNTLTLSVAG